MGSTNGVLLAGRLLLAACFIPPALARLTNISGFAVTLAAKGLPYTDVTAALVVLAETFGPLALVLGLAPRLTALVLIASTVVTTAVTHPFWAFAGPARQAELAVFMTHLGVIAGLLFYLVSGPGAWSWQAWWRSAVERPKPAAKKKAPRPRTPRSRPATEAADAA